MSLQRLRAGLVGLAIALGASASCAQDGGQKPADEALQRLKDELELLKARNDLIEARFKLLTDSAALRSGELSFSSDENRAALQVHERTAAAFAVAAKGLAERFSAVGSRQRECTIVVLGEGDRLDILRYRTAESVRARLAQQAKEVKEAHDKDGGGKLALPSGIFAGASLLAQVSQLSQFFRTNRELSNTKTQFPLEALLDQFVLEWRRQSLSKPSCVVRYPSARAEAIFKAGYSSKFLTQLDKLVEMRAALSAIANGNTSAKAAMEAIDTFVKALVPSDPAAKDFPLHAILRGELSDVDEPGRPLYVASIQIEFQGGQALKVSPPLFFSDRLYASGGVVVRYRLTAVESTGQQGGELIDAGILTQTSPLHRVPLD